MGVGWEYGVGLEWAMRGASGVGLEIFPEQSIDGEVLVECDESALQHELGMDSKVDRIRLMKIISGQYSACPGCSERRLSIIMHVPV